jgi:hypothetical protein
MNLICQFTELHDTDILLYFYKLSLEALYRGINIFFYVVGKFVPLFIDPQVTKLQVPLPIV